MRYILLFGAENLDPIIIRIMDEINSHRRILEADDPVLLMKLMYLIVVAIETEGEMRLILPEFVGTLVVAKPCQFEAEIIAGGGEIF